MVRGSPLAKMISACRDRLLKLPMQNVKEVKSQCILTRGGLITGNIRAGEERRTKFNFVVAGKNDNWVDELTRFYYLSPSTSEHSKTCSFVIADGPVTLENMSCKQTPNTAYVETNSDPCAGLNVDFWEERRSYWIGGLQKK